jgi:aryl carrier-like protein
VPLDPSQRRSHSEQAVVQVVPELTGSSSAELTVETPLMEAGVDSLAATELSSRLRALIRVTLSSTLVFEQPSPRAIAAHLLEQVVGSCAVEGLSWKQCSSVCVMGAAAPAQHARLHVTVAGPFFQPFAFAPSGKALVASLRTESCSIGGTAGWHEYAAISAVRS